MSREYRPGSAGVRPAEYPATARGRVQSAGLV